MAHVSVTTLCYQTPSPQLLILRSNQTYLLFTGAETGRVSKKRGMRTKTGAVFLTVGNLSFRNHGPRSCTLVPVTCK